MKKILEIKHINIVAVIIQVLTAVMLTVVMNISGQISITFGFILISVFTGVDFKNKFNYCAKLFDSNRNRFLFFLFWVYTAVALVGNRALFYPVENLLSFKDTIEFILAFFWSFQMILTALFCFGWITERGFRKENAGIGTLKFSLIFILVMAASCVLTLYAFNPGISDTDSSYSIYFAYHLINCIDWFPPFYYMYLRAIMTVFRSVSAIVICQWCFFTVAGLEAAFLLRKLGIKDAFIFIMAVVIAFNPANFLHLDSIWKDAPYLCSIFWLTVILLKICIFDRLGEKINGITYVELVLALTGTFFFRKNGIVPVVLTLAAVIIYSRINRKLLVACVSCIAVIIMVRFIVYPAFSVRDYKEDKSKQGDAYVGLGQDILGVYYAGGTLSEDGKYIVEGLTNGVENYDYNPTYYNDWKSGLNIGFVDFIRCYINTFFKNPLKMINAVFCRNDGIWAIYHGDFGDVVCIDYHGNEDGKTVGGANCIYDINGNRVTDEWNDYAHVHKDNKLTEIVSVLTHLSANIELVKIFIWRSGLHVWIMLSAVLWAGTKKKHMFIVYVPVLGQIISLLLACGWSVFRYYWPINLLSAVLTVFALAVGSFDDDMKKKCLL